MLSYYTATTLRAKLLNSDLCGHFIVMIKFHLPDFILKSKIKTQFCVFN